MAHQRVSRRAFLAGTAAAGLTAAAPRGRPVEAADPKVLKVRSYYHLETLDPAFQISASDGRHHRHAPARARGAEAR